MSLAEAVSRLQTSPADESSYLPYIKDWHLVHQSRTLSDPGDRVPYQTPSIFMDDCMSLLYWICEAHQLYEVGLNNAPEGQDDFRFCYAGVAGTFTPMHRDICRIATFRRNGMYPLSYGQTYRYFLLVVHQYCWY